MVKKCPECGHTCEETKVAIICPNCDYISMKKIEWQGDHITCPKCKNKAKVYKHSDTGKSFVCDNCRTVGRYIDENKLNNKKLTRSSEEGKKLSWLFEVPCKYWYKKDAVENTICKKCDIRKVCDSHSKEIDKFSKRKDVEIYLHKDFIEVMHK